VLVLLPPSEGKAVPGRARPVDLGSLRFPGLAAPRRAVLDALGALCAGPLDVACETLGLGPTQAAEVAKNRALLTAPTLPAARLYTGVLFDALDLATLPEAARRRAARRVLVSSGLWGVVGLGDRIPAYRLAGGVSLPGLGPLGGFWRGPLSEVLPAAAGKGLVLDLRSGAYAVAWRPAPALAARTVVVRVLQRGKVVSHHNKATKGRIARAVLCAPAEPRRPAELADLLKAAGLPVALTPPGKPGRCWELDVDED
jgi:cytoplasmic iron level regulating protein YaaA (DUF328/UPF0246 family)